jgi:hypothetical protein
MERMLAAIPALRAHTARLAAVPLVVALLTLAGGCGGAPPVRHSAASHAAEPTAPASARGQLAARVAAARDERYVAGYTLAGNGRAPGTVTVTIAMDGSWLVVITGGALGGTVDVAIAGSVSGLYQCALSGTSPGCVWVAAPSGRVPAAADPRVQHLFTDWLGVLTDRQAAISVGTAAALPGSRGECFSVEPSSASLATPVDPGIYCYDTDGTLTAAALAMGTLTLAGSPAPAPPAAVLPAPVVSRDPLPIAGPATPAA